MIHNAPPFFLALIRNLIFNNGMLNGTYNICGIIMAKGMPNGIANKIIFSTLILLNKIHLSRKLKNQGW